MLKQTKRRIRDTSIQLSQAKETHECAHVGSVTGKQLNCLQFVSQILGFVPVGIRPKSRKRTIVDEIGDTHDAQILERKCFALRFYCKENYPLCLCNEQKGTTTSLIHEAVRPLIRFYRHENETARKKSICVGLMAAAVLP